MRPGLRNAVVAGAVAVAVVALLVATRREGAAPTGPLHAAAPALPPASPQSPPARNAPRDAVALAATGKRVDICGYGTVELDDPAKLPAELQSALSHGAPVIRRRVAELGASSDASDRAVALRHEAAIIQQTTIEAAHLGNRGCLQDERCWSAALGMGVQAAAPYVETLTQLARQTNDPVAYAIAYGACRGYLDYGAPGCAAINALRWAELDPDNGAAWLAVAAQATQRRDETERALALGRAAEARHFDNYATALLRPAIVPSSENLTELERVSLQLTSDVAYGSMGLVPYQAALSFCGENDAPERRALCDRLATRLVESDPTLLGRQIGRRIGERVGWPPKRIAALADELDAMMEIGSRSLPQNDATSCAGLVLVEKHNSDLLRFGEIGALQRQIARSGRSPQDLARAFREERERNLQRYEREGAAARK